MPTGTVKSTNPRGFGFIRDASDRSLFFHASGLAPDSGLVFGDQLRELFVQFEVVETDRGPKCVDVRKAR